MKITDIEAIVVQKPSIDTTAADAMQDAFIVRVKTDEGITGIGEGNHTPLAMKAVVDSPGSHSWSQGIKELLIGQDPLHPQRLWDSIYRSTVMSGRRGLGVAVLAAIDVALWDLKGKAENKPIYELLGGASGAPIVPYSSLYFGPADYAQTLETNLGKIAFSQELGFPAYKIEPLSDCVQTNDQIVDMAHRAKRPGGRRDDDAGRRRPSLAVAQGGASHSAADRGLRPRIHRDADVAGRRRGVSPGADGSSIPVAIGELFVTRNEFIEMMDYGARGHRAAERDPGRVHRVDARGRGGALPAAVRSCRTAGSPPPSAWSPTTTSRRRSPTAPGPSTATPSCIPRRSCGTIWRGRSR